MVKRERERESERERQITKIGCKNVKKKLHFFTQQLAAVPQAEVETKQNQQRQQKL